MMMLVESYLYKSEGDREILKEKLKKHSYIH